MIVYKAQWREATERDEDERVVELDGVQVRWQRPGSVPYVHFKESERIVFVPNYQKSPEEIVKKAMAIVGGES